MKLWTVGILVSAVALASALVGLHAPELLFGLALGASVALLSSVVMRLTWIDLPTPLPKSASIKVEHLSFVVQWETILAEPPAPGRALRLAELVGAHSEVVHWMHSGERLDLERELRQAAREDAEAAPLDEDHAALQHFEARLMRRR
jgi:hypothetical protein